ncbi:type II toxin-antitoxin system VapC family toxin [Rarobacter faecitabidus]|uniref:PIN domain-containing protein n=1 Tax=Rarobacter faecitabidus TaxID=13243 RepID=A0A542ZE83_RARFA|nr:type II toxin-antitoxin system VapC family toxin [Rarobacter faecitabidus]TQL58638.1 hypothetical protein FB461_2056 [Rarobacter faecitabidus]
MNFPLETNVLSETRKPSPYVGGTRWLAAQRDEALYTSVLVVGELRRGQLLLAGRDGAAAHSLGRWIDEIQSRLRDRTVTIDHDVVHRWAELSVPDRLPALDGLIAATALVRGWTLVTRNTPDVARTGLRTLNPFSA